MMYIYLCYNTVLQMINWVADSENYIGPPSNSTTCIYKITTYPKIKFEYANFCSTERRHTSLTVGC